MVKISTQYKGSWVSKFHDVEITYNDNVWSVIAESEDEDELMLGLFDKKDGSSFMFNLENVEEPGELSNDDIEGALFADIYNKDNNVVVNRKFEAFLGGMIFNFVEYTFNNKKFGKQKLLHAFSRFTHHVPLFVFSWPIDMPLQGQSYLPLKHQAFIEGLKL
ncbi:MAG: hypothetical protein OEY78_03480 [Gammaproteobacteria bacterium]|nr:hypothetical protein [Gammaproteobacteria bacterium]